MWLLLSFLLVTPSTSLNVLFFEKKKSRQLGPSSASVVRIVGGTVTTIENYPYQLNLLYKGSPICGASILTPKFAISAAHCFKEAGAYSVRAGSTYLDRGGTLIHVDQAVIHPDYNKDNQDCDVSLLILARSLVYSDRIKPIKLPSDLVKEPPEDALGVVTGWGYFNTSVDVQSKELRVVEVPVWNRSECTNVYRYGILTGSMFCAGLQSGKKDACGGDSGGPFVIDGTLFGIVSWGISCAQPGYPGVYTSIPAVRDFIQQYTKL